jgi:hypothetical protein
VQENTRRRTEETSGAIAAAADMAAQSYANLKDRLSGAIDSKNLTDITQVITELGNAGQLSEPVLRRVAAELQSVAASGGTLPPELKRIVDLYGKTTVATTTLSDATKDLMKSWGSNAAADIKELADAWRLMPPSMKAIPEIHKRMIEDYEELRQLVGKDKLPKDIEALWQEYDNLARFEDNLSGNHRELSDAQQAVNKSMGGGQTVLANMAQAAGDLRLVGKDLTDNARQLSPAWRDVSGNFLDSVPILKDLRQRMREAREEFVRTHGALATAMMEFQSGRVYKALNTVDGILSGINQKWAEMATLAVRTIRAVVDNLAEGDIFGAIVAGATGLGKAIANIFGPGEKGKVDEMRQKWIDSAGGWEAINKMAQKAGVTLDRVLNARTVEEYEAALKELEGQYGKVNKALERYNVTWVSFADSGRRLASFQEIIGDFLEDLRLIEGAGYDVERAITSMSGQVLESLHQAFDAGVLDPFLADLVESGRLTQEMADKLRAFAEHGVTDYAALTEMAEEYGIKLEHLGPQFQEAAVHDTALQILNDFDALVHAGADVGAVLNGMSDEVQGFVDDALKYGVSIPHALRPLLQQMLDAGLLVDENGDKLTDLSKLTFADSPLEGGIQDLEAAIRHLIAALGGVPGAISAIGNTPVPTVTIPVQYYVPELPNIPGAGSSDYNAYHMGGMVERMHGGLNFIRAHSGLMVDEVPAILQTGEAVLNRRATSDLGSGTIAAMNGGSYTGGDSGSNAAILSTLVGIRDELARQAAEGPQRTARAVREAVQTIPRTRR